MKVNSYNSEIFFIFDRFSVLLCEKGFCSVLWF